MLEEVKSFSPAKEEYSWPQNGWARPIQVSQGNESGRGISCEKIIQWEEEKWFP